MRGQIDRLADIRAIIRALRAEAKAIQAEILGGDVPLEGEEHVATVRRQIVLKPVRKARNIGNFYEFLGGHP